MASERQAGTYTPTDQAIESAFHDAWEEFGDDHSPEFLLAVAAERMGVSQARDECSRCGRYMS